MKITKLEVEITQKIYLGGFETVEPSIRITAELDPGDTLEGARKILADEAHKLWVVEALEEIRMVHRRRGPEFFSMNDKLPEVMNSLKGMVGNP